MTLTLYFPIGLGSISLFLMPDMLFFMSEDCWSPSNPEDYNLNFISDYLNLS